VSVTISLFGHESIQDVVLICRVPRYCGLIEGAPRVCVEFPSFYSSWSICRKSNSITCRYQVVILSNQGAISLKSDPKTVKADQKSLSNFKARVTSVFRQLDMPVSIYAATDKDDFRKPRVGMWKEMLEDYDLDILEGIDLVGSFFVGDAGGRQAAKGHVKDFSCSDR
jgi:DNA 3'-phosphatase